MPLGNNVPYPTTLILDRFHVVKALNEAVDEVRKEEWRKADKAGKKALKGIRWLIWKHASKRSEEETKSLKVSLYGKSSYSSSLGA